MSAVKNRGRVIRKNEAIVRLTAFISVVCGDKKYFNDLCDQKTLVPVDLYPYGLIMVV